MNLAAAMALSKIKTKPRADRDDIYRRMVAEQIARYSCFAAAAGEASAGRASYWPGQNQPLGIAA